MEPDVRSMPGRRSYFKTLTLQLVFKSRLLIASPHVIPTDYGASDIDLPASSNARNNQLEPIADEAEETREQENTSICLLKI